jgi:hypothetical protein
MRKMCNGSSNWQLLAGIVLAEAGGALIGIAEWDPLKLGASMSFYAGGFLGLVVGMSLIWKEPLRKTMIEDEPSPDDTSSKSKIKPRGRLDLNGHSFEAYEEELDHGRIRFRLRSFPSIGPEREAGFIRYLVHEGFIEQRWPHLSGKIEKEAAWAFLL